MQGLPVPATAHASHFPSPTSWSGLEPVIQAAGLWSYDEDGRPTWASSSRYRPLPLLTRSSRRRRTSAELPYFSCRPRKSANPALIRPPARASLFPPHSDMGELPKLSSSPTRSWLVFLLLLTTRNNETGEAPAEMRDRRRRGPQGDQHRLLEASFGHLNRGPLDPSSSSSGRCNVLDRDAKDPATCYRGQR